MSERKLKRYDVVLKGTPHGHDMHYDIEVDPDPEGNWVGIEDAQALLEALEAIIEDITSEDHEDGDWSEQVVVRNGLSAITKATHGDTK